MVITRFLNLTVFLGSLLGSFSTYSMGGRFRSFAFPKGRLLATALGMGSGGYLGIQSTLKQHEKRFVPECTDANHSFNLNKVGLVHSLPKKSQTILSGVPSTTSVTKKSDQLEDGETSSLFISALMPVAAGWFSYSGTKEYIFNEYNIRMVLKKHPELIVKKTEKISEEEAALLTKQAAMQFLQENPDSIVEPSQEKTEEIATRNAISTGLKTMAKGVVSIGVSKGIAFVAGTDTETVDEVGDFVSTEVEKDAIQDEKEREKYNMVSAGKLALKLGLVWLAYQGVKKLVTYATGYQCQCPELPSSVVGTGNFSKFAKYCIEVSTRGFVKGLIASTMVMPLMGMAKPKEVPPVEDDEIQAMLPA